MEAELELPDGGTKLVIVAGQPIDMGDQPCMLFTFADLEPRRKAEAALRHSEERFTRTFQLAPVPMAIGARDGHRAVRGQRQLHRADRLCRDRDHRPPARRRRPVGERRDARARSRRRSTAASDLRDHEARIRAKDGATIDCIVSTEAIRLGDDACVLWAFQDITHAQGDRARTGRGDRGGDEGYELVQPVDHGQAGAAARAAAERGRRRARRTHARASARCWR